MKDNISIFENVVNQHRQAKLLFIEDYSFKTKQWDIIFHIKNAIDFSEKKKSQALRKISKLEKEIQILEKSAKGYGVRLDGLKRELSVSESVTEDDI